MRKDRRAVTAPNREDIIDQRLVRALAHPLRVEILQILNEREASPHDLAVLTEHPLGNVAYHTRVLEECGCVELVGTARRRGAIEHYFRAKPRPFIGREDWSKVPRSLRGGVSEATLRCFVERVVNAIEAGKIDGREDTTLSWMSMAVDEIGWVQVAEILEEAMAKLQRVHSQSRERVEIGGGDLLPVVVGLAAFESADRA
jgi:DNA-binding transcriptional ArsR family regulator